MRGTSSGPCSYKYCKNAHYGPAPYKQEADVDVAYFKLPKDPTMQKLWLEHISNPNLDKLTKKQVRSQVKVCSLHFWDIDFTDPKKKDELTEDAIPSPDEMEKQEYDIKQAIKTKMGRLGIKLHNIMLLTNAVNLAITTPLAMPDGVVLSLGPRDPADEDDDDRESIASFASDKTYVVCPGNKNGSALDPFDNAPTEQ